MPRPSRRHYILAEMVIKRKERVISYQEVRDMLYSVTGYKAEMTIKHIQNEMSLVRKAVLSETGMFVESIAETGYRITADEAVGIRQSVHNVFMTLCHGAIAGLQYKRIENKDRFRKALTQMLDKKNIDIKVMALSSVRGLIEASATVNKHNQV